MTYSTANIVGSSIPSQSRPDIKTNFDELATFLSTNHADITSTTSGKHKYVSLPIQGSDVSTAASEGCVYTKTNGTVTDLYYRDASDGLVMRASAIKAMANFAGATGTVATGSQNITSVTRSSAGRYVVVMASAMQDTNYLIMITCQDASNFITWRCDITNTTTFNIATGVSSGSATYDPTTVSFVVLR